ncbi:MAG: sugar ABC transporter permease [Clostridia bacterium]
MAKRKVLSWEKKRKRYGYVFTLPFIIGAVFFILIPVITSLIYSLSTLGINPSGYSLTFVGFENFKYLFTVDPDFLNKLGAEFANMVPNVAITVIFSFFIASILNQKFIGRTLARGIFFLPVILASGVYITLSNVDSITTMMAQSSNTAAQAGSVSGAFVAMLQQAQLPVWIIDFLTASVDKISTIVLMSAIPIVIFLAGFQSVSTSIFEASYMEGATKWEVFWKISLPMVSPLILVSVIYVIIDSFTSSSNMMIALIHKTTFGALKYGLGAAMAWSYMVGILAVIGIIYFVINRYVSYYD